MKLVSFSLRPVAPFRLDYTVWALRRRPDNIVDQWEALDALPDEKAETKLLSLKGVGRWSAQYVLLRGLGRLGVFPGDDVGGARN